MKGLMIILATILSIVMSSTLVMAADALKFFSSSRMGYHNI